MNTTSSKRNNTAESIAYDELAAILRVEAKRPVIEEKRSRQLVDYSLAQNWLKLLDLDTNPFSETHTIQSILEHGDRAKERLAPLTLKRLQEGDTAVQKLLQQITTYLSHNNSIDTADYIFVFGSRNIGRIQKGVELWKEGLAPRIWISGGHPFYEVYEPEAVIFRDWAIANGVPEDAIFIEPDSITIADNTRRSLNLMDDLKVQFSKMILVVDWYAQRRAWATMERHVVDGVQLMNYNAQPKRLSQTAWFTTDFGINTIFNEFLKMQVHDRLVMSRLI